jgi:hypothetical protein
MERVKESALQIHFSARSHRHKRSDVALMRTDGRIQHLRDGSVRRFEVRQQ